MAGAFLADALLAGDFFAGAFFLGRFFVAGDDVFFFFAICFAHDAEIGVVLSEYEAHRPPSNRGEWNYRTVSDGTPERLESGSTFMRAAATASFIS